MTKQLLFTKPGVIRSVSDGVCDVIIRCEQAGLASLLKKADFAPETSVIDVDDFDDVRERPLLVPLGR